MKKKFRNELIIKNFTRCLLMTWVWLSSPILFASVVVDKQYRLESIGLLKSWDNVDGLLADYVASAFGNYFAHQSRFLVNDLSKADAILADAKIPYRKIIQDSQILMQISRSSHSDSMIRTEVLKEGGKYFFTLEWLYSPQMEIMATQRFTMMESNEGAPLSQSAISEEIGENLPKLFNQVPFIGMITGRDGVAVTLNLGSSAKLKKGDVLKIGTLDEVKKHPLFKNIVDWKVAPTGKIIIDQADENMSFGRVIEEEPGKTIVRYQKILEIQSTPAAPDEELTHAIQKEAKQEQGPVLGWVAMQLGMGSYSRQFSSNPLSINNTGSGSTFGGKASGEIWLTRDWFANAEFGYSSGSFSQKEAATGELTAVSKSGGVSESVFSTKFNLGYSFFLTPDLVGPKIWFKVGYKTHSYSLPNNSSEMTGPVSLNSFFLGTGGSLPIQGKVGAFADLNFRVLSSVTQSFVASSGVNSTSDAEFALGGYYRVNSTTYVRATLNIEATGVDFVGGSSLSQKTVTFGPSLLYYF